MPFAITLLVGTFAVLASGCEVGETALTHPAAPPEQVAQGRRLLAQYQCGSCHAIPGVGDARGLNASSLDGFGRRSYIAGRIANGPQALAAWIAAPHAQVAQTTMPSMGASAADAQAMAAYLLTLD